LATVERSALQIVKNVGVEELIDRCSLLVEIALNFFSLSPILVALDNRPKKKETKTYKLKK
jgi:hypothetical protein